MTIRPADRDDLPQMLEMAQDFYAYSKCSAHGLGYDERDLIETIEHYALHEFLRVAELHGRIVGVIAGAAMSWYARRSDTVVQEVWLWTGYNAPAGVGKALLEALEAWGRELGATVVMIATPGADERHERVMPRLYRRWGYAYAETNFFKSLEA